MAVVVNFDLMLVRRKMKLMEMSDATGISVQNLSVLKPGKARAIHFSTLDSICQQLRCQPGDLLEYQESLDVDESINYPEMALFYFQDLRICNYLT